MSLEAAMEAWMALDNEHAASVSMRHPEADGWREMKKAPLPGQHAWHRHSGQLVAIWTVGPHPDPDRYANHYGWWLHVSCSAKGRVPTHEQMTEVKHLFIGPERWAYSVWAPAPEHINIHDYCLHLWAPWDNGPRLPDFGRYGTI